MTLKLIIWIFFLHSTIPLRLRNQCTPQSRNTIENVENGTKFEVRTTIKQYHHPSCKAANLTENVNLCTDTENPYNGNKDLLIAMKMTNTGILTGKVQYIVIDHIYDKITRKNERLLIPYVIKIRQEPILQTYNLKFKHVVNALPVEKVFNKDNDAGYSGCSITETNPTCGSIKYNNEIVPYSTGYCCTCDNNDELIGVDSKSEGLIHADQDDDGQSDKCTTVDDLDSLVNLTTLPALMDHNDFYTNIKRMVYDGLIMRKGRHQSDRRRFHKRGGQDCSDTYTPPHVNPNSYHDSTHCMEFSNKWYSVYAMEDPQIQHEIQVQVYKKLEDSSGENYWIDLTKGVPLNVGTRNAEATNDESTIFIQYNKISTNEHCTFSLKIGKQKLLIPEAEREKNDEEKEADDNVGEYLVLPNENIDESGSVCNVAGVGFEAFVKQKNRCKMERNSCFENQPNHFWQFDHNLDNMGIRGCYFLKNFADIPENGAIKGDCENNNKTLSLFYKERYENLLNIHIQNENNFVLYKNKFATITEIYADATFYKKIIITVKVSNSGLVSGLFSVNLRNFPMILPASLNAVHSKIVLIPPQHQHIFTLEIECDALSQLKSDVSGHIQVRNKENVVIAWRKIRINNKDRCICIWHCKCACWLYDNGLKCNLLQLNEYYAAGFQGSPPISQEFVQYTIYDDMLSIMQYFFLFLFLLFLFLGLLKGLLGIIFVPIGLYGLDVVLDLPKPIKQYYERDLEYRTVIYDQNGWPVHPDNRKPVHNMKIVTEFCINLLFFFIYPFALIFYIVRKVCFITYEDCEEENQVKRTNQCRSCERHFICSNSREYFTQS